MIKCIGCYHSIEAMESVARLDEAQQHMRDMGCAIGGRGLAASANRIERLEDPALLFFRSHVSRT